MERNRRIRLLNSAWGLLVRVTAGALVAFLAACSAFPPATPASAPATAPAPPTATALPTLPTLKPTRTAVPTVEEAAPTPTFAITQGPLSVLLSGPEDGAEISAGQVELRGEADPETVITIAEQIVVVDAGRTFHILLALDEGPNVFEITASDPQGNQGTTYYSLFYEP